MTDLRTEIESLIHNGLLPDREYVSAKRFINHYANTNEFWAGLALVGITPIINGYMLATMPQGQYGPPCEL